MMPWLNYQTHFYILLFIAVHCWNKLSVIVYWWCLGWIIRHIFIYCCSMLFIDFSSAFNTIIPQQLINKLNLLGLNNSLCNWILDFLTGRPQSVRVGHNTSSTTTLSTGAPQGCVLSPLLFTLLTHDCTAKFSSNHIIKFADDTTVVGLISNNDETHYREEVAQLAEWCGANNLSLKGKGKGKWCVAKYGDPYSEFVLCI